MDRFRVRAVVTTSIPLQDALSIAHLRCVCKGSGANGGQPLSSMLKNEMPPAVSHEIRCLIMYNDFVGSNRMGDEP